MSNKKMTSTVLLVAGVILVILSLIADIIGIGQAAGFGYKQIAGSVVGLVAAIAGFVIRPKA